MSAITSAITSVRSAFTPDKMPAYKFLFKDVSKDYQRFESPVGPFYGVWLEYTDNGSVVVHNLRDESIFILGTRNGWMMIGCAPCCEDVQLLDDFVKEFTKNSHFKKDPEGLSVRVLANKGDPKVEDRVLKALKDRGINLRPKDEHKVTWYDLKRSNYQAGDVYFHVNLICYTLSIKDGQQKWTLPG